MKRKRIVAIFACILLSYIIPADFTNAQVVKIDDESKKENSLMKYTYEDEVVSSSWTKEYAVTAGKNYAVTISFTGVSESPDVISFAYDKVSDDQIVPNVVSGSSDRSGLLLETVKAGVTETRNFEVAATTDVLTLTATGNAKILSVDIVEKTTAEKDEITVFTIGDSLVQTYAEKYLPQTGWGQKIEEYFTDGIAFRNYAIGGRSTGNFLRQGRLNEVLLNLTAGDYVLIQFGHNDATAGNEDRYVSVEDYKTNLKEEYIKPILQRGATPILVTLANRNDYNASTGAFNVSFSEYVAAMREVAEETGTKLIDLNAKTVEYFTELNKKYGVGITEGIIYNHAIAGAYLGEYVTGVEDNTHLQGYGAEIVAGMVAEGLCDLDIDDFTARYTNTKIATEVPGKATNISTKKYSGFISRIKWDAAENADFYKVMVADVKDGEVSGEYKLAGYTTICDFAYDDAALRHDYAYKVIAVNDAGESEEADVFIFEAAKTDTTRQTANYLVKVDSEGQINVGVVIAVVAGIVLVIGAIVAAIVVSKKKAAKKES